VISLYNIMYPNGAVQELSVYGYDPETKAYWNYDFDSTGLNSVGQVVFKDGSWTHVWSFKMGGKPARLRPVDALSGGQSDKGT